MISRIAQFPASYPGSIYVWHEGQHVEVRFITSSNRVGGTALPELYNPVEGTEEGANIDSLPSPLEHDENEPPPSAEITPTTQFEPLLYSWVNVWADMGLHGMKVQMRGRCRGQCYDPAAKQHFSEVIAPTITTKVSLGTGKHSSTWM